MRDDRKVQVRDEIRRADQVLQKAVEGYIKTANLPPQRFQILKEVLNIIDRLEKSSKIIIDDHERLVWVATDNPKLRKLVKESKEV